MKTGTRNLMIAMGAVGAVGAAVAMGAAVWNSRRMKLLRAYRRAGRILDRVGVAMQTVAGMME